jgi:F-type H+-transporting ATPase subunit a
VEHPYLFFVELFGLIGLGDFAHHYVHIIYTWVVMIFLIVVGALAGRSVHLIPNKMQNVAEVLIHELESFMVTVTGEEGRKFFPYAMTLFIFIFVSNMVHLIPGFFPPTVSLNTTVALALCTFFLTHIIGIMFHGTHYYAHFIGPVWWMIPLILPIEIVGHCARVLSLSFRLFGNMLGKELTLMILFGLAGLYLAPIPIMVLFMFSKLVQAFVFFLLSIMYFASAMEDAH